MSAFQIFVDHPLNQKFTNGSYVFASLGNEHSADALLIRTSAEFVILARAPTMRPIGRQLNLVHLTRMRGGDGEGQGTLRLDLHGSSGSA